MSRRQLSPVWLVAWLAVALGFCVSLESSGQISHAATGNETTVYGQKDPPVGLKSVTTPSCYPDLAAISSPNMPDLNQIHALDGVSSGDMWAVGNYLRGFDEISQSLIAHWDGESWSQLPVPVAVTTSTSLRGVASAATNPSTGSGQVAWAVGSTSGGGQGPARGLILRWDGEEWRNVPVPTSCGLYCSEGLAAVSALTPDDVWVVGSHSEYGGRNGPLILHWDGVTWAEFATPASAEESHLQAVTALSANDVWAVGGYLSGTPAAGVVLHWDGQEWSQAHTIVASTLFAVEAISPNDVWAAGRDANNTTQPVLVHWDGSSWTRVPGPVLSSYSQVRALSAISASDVWAVGYDGFESYPGYGDNHMFVLHWDGSQWSEVTPPGEPEEDESKLYAVKAFPDAQVWVAGAFDEHGTLTARSQGADWAIVPSPNPGTGRNTLRGVDALSANDVWAVGDFYTQGSRRTRALIQHWDGARWSIVPQVPDPTYSGPHIRLYDVKAITPSDVWAVGTTGPDPESWPFTLHWDGTNWTIVESPNMGAEFAHLYAVDGVSSTDVWAVGYWRATGNSLAQPLILRWDGAVWSAVPGPSVQTDTFLQDIVVVSANDAWAAGYTLQAGLLQPTMMHWNGTHWALSPLPDVPNGLLSGIAAVSATDLWAVGHINDYPDAKTLTMHWDGTLWSEVPSPNAGRTLPTYLTSVDAVAANDVWAVGWWGSQYPRRTVAMHWDGTQWTIIPTDDPGALDDSLFAVTAISSHDVWAVGKHFGFTPDQTLIEHFGRFNDVQPTDYFNAAVEYLVSRGAISGYEDCTFRPYANTTRGQLCKIIVLAEGWSISTRYGPHFEDVPIRHAFYQYIETAYWHGIISGYRDGTFRPSNDITRGQLAKIITLAEQWPINTQGGPHFSDVLPGSPFYPYVETAYNRAAISGYADGTFRPGNSATRGQIAKIVYNAVR